MTIGDFATTRAGGTFTLAYLVRNTITNLTTQDEQVECFRNVAAHLEPGGCFVIEVYIPELRRLPPGETIHAFTVTPAHLGFRGVRPCAADRAFPSLLGGRRPASDPLVAAPLRMAVRAGPHGATRRDDPARALEQLEARALHQRQQEPRLGLAETS